MSLVLHPTESHGRPFQYVLFDTVFSPRKNRSLLTWLENSQDWVLVERDFYEQYEFCIDDATLPSSVAFLQSDTFRARLKAEIDALFSAKLSNYIRVVAHKLIPGQHIGIHNDVVDSGESHRFTVQLNSGLAEGAGGYFMLFNSADPSDIHRILRPIDNTAIAFSLSENSNHAVSRQHLGIRYTLVFCFHAP